MSNCRQVNAQNLVAWWEINTGSSNGLVLLGNKPLIKQMSKSYDAYDINGDPWVNTQRVRKNGRHFPDDIFKCIFVNENVWISFKISLKFVPKGPINNIPSLVQIMAWRRPGDKPLSEPMMV